MNFMHRSLPWCLLLVFLVALALRGPQLAERPMHNDEAVNGIKFRTLWQGGGYRYDPHEYHGPALPYATYAVAWLRHGGNRQAEPDEITLRLVPLLAGLLLVFVPWLGRGSLRSGTMMYGSALTALSPVMVYFSRYYIHELLLVLGTAVLLLAAGRNRASPRLAWTLLAGAGLGLMVTSKETFVIPLASMVGAAAAQWLWRRWRNEPNSMEPAPQWKLGPILAGAGLALAMALLLFTSFFTNAAGPSDALRTYLPWLDRAGGASPHIRPWWFYGERLLWFHFPRGPVWTEAFIAILGLVGFVAALRKPAASDREVAWIRFLGFYSLGLAAAYSVIGYKTPWCALGFWQPWLMVAGAGAVVLWEYARQASAQWALAALLFTGGAHLGWEAWRESHFYGWRRQNPWVFAHTSADLLKLVERLRALATVHPQGKAITIKIMAPEDDYWPLPWYLRDFPNVGYYGQIPKDPWAPVIVSSVQFQAALETRPERSHLMAGLFELRPQPQGVPPTTFELYVSLPLWSDYLKAHPPRPDDD